MPTVVIAGGTSPSLGHSLVTAILTLTPHWHPVILSRSSSSSSSSSSIPTWLAPLLSTTPPQATLLHVNYSDHHTLVSALRSADAHTVISVLGFTPSPASPASSTAASWFSTQISLLEACAAAGVKRFAPSEFGVGVHGTPRIDALAGNVRVWEACARSGMEWTRFECGLFMNYLGFGVAAGGDGAGRRSEALAGREGDGEWFFYSSRCAAELPLVAGGGGTFPRVTMTALEDVGRFVARSLDLPEGAWETTSYMVGETLRLDEVVAVAERVMGKKWEVVDVSPEELEARIEELGKKGDARGKMWAQLGLCYTRDAEGEGWLEGRLNDLFPDVKPLTVEGYLMKYYG